MSEHNSNQHGYFDGSDINQGTHGAQNSQWGNPFWPPPSPDAPNCPPQMYWNPYPAFVPNPGFVSPPTQPAPPPPFPVADLHPPPMPSPQQSQGCPLVEEIGTTPQSGTKKVATKKAKEQNFKPDEDILLCNTWVEISSDPVISTCQRKEGLWARIVERYNEKRGQYPSRLNRAVSSRWDKIRPECSKFTGYYARVLRENQSGQTDHDKTTRAATEFTKEERHVFAYMHCWDVLKNEPKWHAVPYEGTSSATGGGGSKRTSTAMTVDDFGDSTPGLCSQRPLGRDSAKAARKKTASTCSSSSEYISSLRELALENSELYKVRHVEKMKHLETFIGIEMSKIEVEKDKVRKKDEFLELEKKKLDLEMEREHKSDRKEKEKELERLFIMDLESIPSVLKNFYMKKRKELLDELMDN